MRNARDNLDDKPSDANPHSTISETYSDIKIPHCIAQRASTVLH